MTDCITNIANKSIKSNGKKNILTIICIVLSTCLITSIGILSYSIQRMLLASSIESSSGTYEGIYTNLSDVQLNELKNNVKFQKVGEVIEFGKVIKSSNSMPNLIMHYYDKDAVELSTTKLKSGSLPKKANEIALQAWVIKKFNAVPKLGQTIHIKYIAKNIKEDDFVISGILENNKKDMNGNNSDIFISREYVQNNSSAINIEAITSLKSRFNIKESLSDIRSAEGIKSANLIMNEEYIDALGGDPSIILSAAAICAIVVIATIVVIYNIFYISVIEKTQQFGLLASLGATKKQIKKLILKEGLSLSTIGVILGIILGHIISFIIIPLFSIGEIKVFTSPIIILFSAAVSFLTVLAALRKPGKIASKISPTEASRYNGSTSTTKKKERKSSALINIKKMAYLNLFRNKKRTIMTIFSLTMSGILFIVICSILESMNVKNLTKIYFPHEFTVEVSNTNYKDDYNTQIMDKIKNANGIKKIYTRVSRYDTKTKNKGNLIYGYDDGMLNFEKKYIESGDISPEAMKKNDEIILVHQKDISPGYKVNDMINVTFISYDDNHNIIDSFDKSFKIAGIVNKCIDDESIYPDENMLIFSKDTLKKVDNNKANITIDNYIDIDHKNYDSILSLIKSVKASNSSIWYDSYTKNVNQIKNEFKGISAAAYSLVGIIALIGTLNLINTMITSILTRQKEFGIMQAIGLSNRQLKNMLQIEGLYYSLSSALVSVLLGSTLGYLLYTSFKKSATYAVYSFPIIPIVLVIVVFIVVQILVTFLVSKNLRKGSLSERIRYDE